VVQRVTTIAPMPHATSSVSLPVDGTHTRRWHSACRSIAETFGRSDWLELLHGKGDERSGVTIYGTTKLFNIMLAKVCTHTMRTWYRMFAAARRVKRCMEVVLCQLHVRCASADPHMPYLVVSFHLAMLVEHKLTYHAACFNISMPPCA
jgi:hypothetical protein